MDFPEGGKIVLEINPKPPNPSETLHFNATFHEFTPQAVRISFEGRDMYMGFLEFGLEPLKPAGESLEFAGNGGIFVCRYGVMPWVVLVIFQVDGRVYEAPFEFETIYHQPQTR